MDNGFNTSHEDLSGKITFIDDLGENIEEVSHGTSVSGIVGAKNNNVGICGVAYNSNIIAADFSNLSTGTSLFAAYNALINNGVRVINMSFNHRIYDDKRYDDKNADGSYINNFYEPGITYDEYLDRHIEYVTREGILHAAYVANCQKDVLFVQSAGNGFNNAYQIPANAYYGGGFASCSSAVCEAVEKRYSLPKGYVKSHILIVTSIENSRKSNAEYWLVSGANRGETVDICAPGLDIYTTDKNGGYINSFSGTSAAAPFVTGVAALCFSINPSLTAAEVRDILINENTDSGVAPDNLFGYTEYPLVDAYRSVAKAYKMRSTIKDVELRFIDTATNSNLTCNKVNLEIISSDIHATSTVSLIHRIFTDGSASNYSTATIDLPYGAYVINFSANGYQDIVDIWTSPDDADFIVDESTTEFTIYMTPKVSPDPDTPDGFNITGTFVYLNDTNEEIPVSFAKCTLKDVTSNRNYYFAEVIDGRLSNEAFLTKPSSGTYLFELEGGDADDNGFYSRKVIENVVINSDFDFGKIYCDRVAYVSGTVVNENGEYLDNIGMTITQNGTTAMKIDNFDQGFYITLKEGLYTLTLTREGYSSYMTDFAVRGTTDLGTIELTPANSSSITMRIRFVDADSGEQLKISSIFDTTSYIGIGNSHLSDNSGFISGDFIDGSKGTNAFTVNNDSELIFINVPIFRDGYYYLGYYLSFDSSEKGYAIPDYYTIPALDITENYNGELEVDVKLDKVVLIVGDITVTEENAADILGDGTANFDSTNGVLTLINANITADYTVYTNMLELKIAIPSGTSSKLTITPVKYRGNTGGIQAAKYLSIYGGGTLTIDGQMGVNAINAGYYDDNYTVEISNITLNMPSSHTTGIMANTGNLILDGVTISKTGVEDYGHLIVGKDITIRNSTIDMSSNGSNLIWSSGGNISIADSNIDLVSELSTPAAFYSIFAEVGTIIVSGNTSISITTNKTDVTTDGEIFVATNGITLNNNLGVSDGNDECEIYNNEYQTSIRCVGSNTYPAKIIIQNN